MRRNKRILRKKTTGQPVIRKKAPKKQPIRKFSNNPLVRQAFTSAGSMGGAALGNMIAPGIGGTIGGALGGMVGRLGSLITGHGDYDVKQNVLVRPGPVPSFGESSIRIRHKEYLGDLSGSTSFAITSRYINPGLPSTFPWLSSLASNFEQYHFNGLVFQFVSTSADALNSTNTALGKVIMATDYNALDANYSNASEMLITLFSNYGKPSEHLYHAIECAAEQTPTKLYYVRSSTVFNGDQRLYDLGNFQVATEGMQAAANIGGLWVTYDVTLVKPVISPLDGASRLDKWKLFGVTSVTGLAGNITTPANPLLGGFFTNNTATSVVYNFPTSLKSGTYQVTVALNSESVALTYNPITINVNSNCILQTSLINQTVGLVSSSGLSPSCVAVALIRLTNTNASITISSTYPVASSIGDFIVKQQVLGTEL